MKPIEKLDWYLTQIAQLWPEFVDDGLSGGFPDWLYARHDLWIAGRIHDWHYCSRCHPEHAMNQAHRMAADLLLLKHSKELLPWYLQVAPYVLYFGVRWFGGNAAWDSCGPTRGARCRHNILLPDWMEPDD